MEFVSYDGAWPNLCSGKLVLRIGGEEVSDFHLYSGGRVWFDEDWGEHVESGPWSVRPPEEYRDLRSKIEKVVNDNVPCGCCGGCI